ncbi:MAG: response regulator [Actinomycetota bacterium]|jgi:two-component system cell cycle response regulator DivK|nr:response regulator [Actinomycetota bacterium]
MATRILIAEDDPQNLYLVKFLLENRGYEVLTAADGHEAVVVARAENPDLVLMDMLLPRVDGYEATRMLKADEGFSRPVVALTAYSMKGDREAILEAGCDGYIPKPIDPNTFVDQVEKYL